MVASQGIVRGLSAGEHTPQGSFFFFFNDTATTEIYTLSLHDALPISRTIPPSMSGLPTCETGFALQRHRDRKSTRLNSSHDQISYAVFCLKKKKIKHGETYLLYGCSRHRFQHANPWSRGLHLCGSGLS